MYKLDNNVEWTEELKNAFKTGTTRAKIIYDGNQEINETNMLKNLELKDTQYVPSLGFIGQACSKELTFSFVNSEGINLENKELTLKIGAEYNGDVYYINYGNFIVCEAPHNDKTNNVTSVVANDYMIKFDVPYEDTITYPCTLKELAQNICEAVGVELGSEEFSNSDFVVVDNQFEGSTAKEVIKNIAKSAFSWARIGQDNKLYFDLESGEEKEEEGTSFTLENPNYLQGGSIIKLTNENESTLVEGTTFELTDADVDKKHSIIELEGNTTQNGTPTPSSPIEVSTVSGDNEVVVCGKNKLKINDFTLGSNGLTYTCTNGIIRIQGTAGSLGYSTLELTPYVNMYELNAIPNGTQLTFSVLGITGIGASQIFIGQTGNLYYWQPSASTKMVSKSKSAEITRVVIWFTTTQGKTYDIYMNPQFEVGSTATDYEPHVGNSYRVDFGGKNKLPNNQTSQTINGVTFTVNSDKSIKIQGTATAQIDFYFVGNNNQYDNLGLESGTYNLSGCSGGSGTTYMLYLVGNRNGALYYYQNFDESGRNVIVEKGDTFRIFIRIMNGTTINTTMYPMLEEGNVKTQYSPYVSNPIELCKIGNYVDKLKRAEGKQLFDKDDVENDKRLDSSGQPITNSASGFSLTNYIKVEPNTKYTYSRNTTSSSYYVNICEYTSDKTHIQRLYKAGDTTTTFTFTTPSNCYYLRINDATTNLYSIMLNEGTTALPYEPYGTNWYIEKNIGKVVLNGSEYYGNNTNWDNQATNILHCFTNDINTTWKVGQSGFLSDRFICTTESGRNFSQEMITCHTTNASVYIFINFSRLNGVTSSSTSTEKVNALKTWLSNNNVTLYYILKNPTYEIIDNENLIEQLNNIQNIELIENLCYVDWVGIEKPDMTLKYNQTIISGDNEVVVKNKNFCSMNRTTPLGNFNTSNNAATHSVDIENRIVTVTPNTSSTGANKGIYWQISTDYYKNLIANKNAVISFDLKADSNCVIRTSLESGQGNIVVDRNVTIEWQRFELSFNRPLASWTAFTFYEREGTDAVFYIKDIQVEQNTQATSFEPHRMDSYRIDFGGKNEFHDYYQITDTNNGITRTLTDNGIILNGTYNKNANMDLWLTKSSSAGYSNNMTLLEANTQYTISIRAISGSFNISNITCNLSSRTVADKTFAWNYQTLTLSNNVWKKTFTPTTDIYVGGVRLYFNKSNTTAVFNNAELGIQIEKGTTDTQFSPYVSNPIELTEDDTIQKVEGEWCVNETPIDNDYLTTQLDNLQTMALYEGINYIDWIGKFKATMLLKYFSDQDVTFEEITTHDYKVNSFKHADEYYGRLNRVGYADSDIEGQEEYVQNAEDIEENGLKDLFIYDNLFAYTEAKRQQLVLAAQKLLGFRYMPIQQMDLKGLIYLDCTDYLKITDADEDETILYSRCLNHTIKYQGYVADSIESLAQSETERTFENLNSPILANTRTQVIVDKANKKINLAVESVEETQEKVSELEISVDEISSTVNALTDVSMDSESSTATVTFENVNASEPIGIKVHPLASPGIKCICPSSSLYPSNTLYMTERVIRFERTYEEEGETKTENIDYQMPADLLYYDSTHYDEFELDYNNKICKIIKRCQYNSSGSIVPLSQEQEIEYDYPEIILLDGDYTINIMGYNVGYLYVKLMKQNPYTSQFTTQVQTKSEIQVTAEGISSEVATKVGENEIISKINQSAEQIQINADKISIEGKAVNFTTNIEKPYVFSSTDIDLLIEYLMGREQLSSEQIELYDVNGDGFVDTADYVVIQKAIANNDGVINGTFSIDPYSTERSIILKQYDGTIKTYVGLNGIKSNNITGGTVNVDGSLYVGRTSNEDATAVWATEDQISVRSATSESVVTAYDVTTPEVIQTSREEDKKNFEKLSNGLDIILNTDIYKYHLKTQDDKDKKHIGFVIGDKFKHSREITSEKGNKEVGVDLYSMIAACYKAIQEQQNKIEELEKKIKGEN